MNDIGPPALAVVGGGAAGLATAIFAAEAGARVVVLDGAKALGAKILVSGGGRCNVTHARVAASDYNGPGKLVRRVLAAFDVRRTVAWFASLGVELKTEETGKLFPVTDRARTVIDALLARCAALGVRILAEHRVEAVEPRAGGGFDVRHSRGDLVADRVVLATGGRSMPRTGSDGHGYEIVRRLGHTVGDTWPALVPLLLADGFFHAGLSGVSHEAELTVAEGSGRVVDRREGSLLWTGFGISGPLAMDASRHWLLATREDPAAKLLLSFLPGADPGATDRFLLDAATVNPRRSVPRILGEILPARVAEAVAAHAGLDPARALSDLRREERRTLVRALTALPLPVTGDRGWRFAEVTAGGVPLEEVDLRTMESRRVPGLFLAGEILDVDGRIGGFNFQWAWSTGFLAGATQA